jgi:hypothetical protein
VQNAVIQKLVRVSRVLQSAPANRVADAPETSTQGPAGALFGRPELRVALLLTGFVFGVALLLRKDGNYASHRQHMGAEYFAVARALVDGRGFSDPFGEPTGPTAWVPPFYPALLAGLLHLLERKSLVGEVIVVFTNFSLIFAGTTSYALARRCCSVLPASLTVGIYGVWLAAHHYWFFVLTGDIWLQMLTFSFMLIVLYRYVTTREQIPWQWGVTGAAAAFTSPALAITWGMLFVLFFVQNGAERRKWLLAAAIAVALTVPWIVRNAVVFHRFIPMKSNAAYELYQANVGDEDGVYTVESFDGHPYVKLEERALYARAGELSYIAERQQIARRWILANPLEFAKRIVNRAYTATIGFVPIMNEQRTWATARLQRIVHPLPFLLLAASIWIRGPARRLLRVCGLFYGVYLAGYVVVAYYDRFLLPLTPMLLLFTVLGADQLVWRVRQRLAGRLRSA